MTVTKGKRNYSFPVGSGNNSDVESLHLGSASASDTESNNEPASQSRPLMPPVFKGTREELGNLKKNSGRKKLRRYQNRCLLQTLAEEEEDDGSLVVIMEPYASPFAKLLQDDDALQFWNAFVDKSEEEQARVVAAFSQKQSKSDKTAQREKPSARISHKIKRTIKIRKNLSLEQVKQSEDDLIAFFKSTPSQVYVKCPASYFERLLLHAIAQYHDLQSLGMNEDGNKRVEIYNTREDWNPADCFLTDFVAQLRK
ncbi:R3H domain-containing protein 4 [Tribolium castaneum]|uniref:R3H domain-containing protein 4-like Protein n=1 Tax=Tribolium castaneum TaxID=7070 RepID=D6W7S8_TRICA|nr:PREDICTED: R3H domain-containing protein 4 [Tribolium castaneum]EFA11236.1 R3H domain-containing protein 4-like Protein [Tribolium castaneum]|eukprot:XP_973748.1 PREDICTED: R3H domain-containing protein 4 [Tribolium castaneum]